VTSDYRFETLLKNF